MVGAFLFIFVVNLERLVTMPIVFVCGRNKCLLYGFAERYISQLFNTEHRCLESFKNKEKKSLIERKQQLLLFLDWVCIPYFVFSLWTLQDTICLINFLTAFFFGFLLHDQHSFFSSILNSLCFWRRVLTCSTGSHGT